MAKLGGQARPAGTSAKVSEEPASQPAGFKRTCPSGGHVSSYITEKDGGIPSNCTLKKVMMEMRFPLLRDGGGKVHDL